MSQYLCFHTQITPLLLKKTTRTTKVTSRANIRCLLRRCLITPPFPPALPRLLGDDSHSTPVTPARTPTPIPTPRRPGDEAVRRAAHGARAPRRHGGRRGGRAPAQDLVRPRAGLPHLALPRRGASPPEPFFVPSPSPISSSDPSCTTDDLRGLRRVHRVRRVQRRAVRAHQRGRHRAHPGQRPPSPRGDTHALLLRTRHSTHIPLRTPALTHPLVRSDSRRFVPASGPPWPRRCRLP